MSLEVSTPIYPRHRCEEFTVINRQRIRNFLIELIKIDSLSRREYDVAMRLKREMEELGATVFIDDAGEKVGGNVGNLIAKFPGNAPASQPLLLSAHMDTVVPGEGIVPILDGDILRTDGTTVLGGDDKSGVAIICEVMRVIKENGLPCSAIDVVFTICEEAGLIGAKCLDVASLRARTGLVLDSDSVGFLFTRAPAANRMEFRVHGLEAHAGVCPEKGINAIKVAAEGIAQMQLGRIDHETTANIGVVEGGMAVNIVPNQVVLKGEARSHDSDKLKRQTEHMQRCLEEAAASTFVGVRRQAPSSAGRSQDRARLRPHGCAGKRAHRPAGSRRREEICISTSKPAPPAAAATPTCSIKKAWWSPTSAPACARSTRSTNGSI